MANYNVIIIDDDIENAKKVSKIINYNEKNFDCVSIFSNGNDALDFLSKNTDIDVVISDIEMPYIDGFQLANLIKKQYPNISIVLMMSYNAYEYAKKALDLNIQGLIKKPINVQELATILNNIYIRLNNRQIKDNKISKLKEYQEDSLQIVRDSILYSLVKSSNKQIKDDANKLNDFGIDLNYQNILVSCLEFERSNMDCCLYDRDKLISSIRKITNEVFEKSNKVEIFRVYEKLFVIIKFNNVNSTVLTNVDSCFIDIIKRVNKELSINISVGVSSLNTIDNLTTAYNQSKQAINYCSFMGKNKIYYYDEHMNAKTRTITSIELEKLDQLITFGEIKDIDTCLDDIKLKMKEIKNINDYYLIISRIVYHILNKSENLQDIYEEFGVNGDFYGHLMSNTNLDSMFDILKQICRFIKEDNSKALQNNVQHNIKRVLIYIETNYNDQTLSLETVASAVNLSVSYICYLLKKEKNTTFVKYITDLRINKAKELLKTTNYKISDIAIDVGYSDAYYFSHNFKKVCGVSPKEYRNNQ